MRQRRWLELIKDYDCVISYHARKTNVVVDALSRKERLNTIRIASDLARELARMEISMVTTRELEEKLCAMTFQPVLLEKIKKYQKEVMNQGMNELTGEEICTQLDGQGILRFA